MGDSFKTERSSSIIAALSIVLLSAGWILAGCQVAQQIGLLPTLTATPNVPGTQTAQAAAQTADAQASATVQAQASATAQAIVAATALAQSQATSTAQRAATITAQAQQTAATQATQQALLAYLSTQLQTSKKVYGPADGVLQRTPAQVAQLNVASLFTSVYIRNFVAEVHFYNPADPAIHPWDYGIAFRRAPLGRCAPEYRFRMNSDQTYSLAALSGKTNPDNTCDTKAGSSGLVKQMDVSSTGSNLIRLVVIDKAAYVFVNEELSSTLDVSESNVQGDIWIATGFQVNHMFPELAARYTGFVVSSLPE